MQPQILVSRHWLLRQCRPWAAGLVLAGVCGAVQSSVGGMVVSLAGTFVSDIYSKLINPNAKPETVKKLNMCSIIVVAIIVFLFACDPPELLASLITYASGGMTVAFFHVLLLGLFWKPGKEYGAVAGIISGIALFLLIDKGILPLSLGRTRQLCNASFHHHYGGPFRW